MANNTIKVTFTGDSSDLKRALKDVDDETKKTSDGWSTAAKVGGAALAGGAVAAGVALYGMAEAAAEDEKAQAALAKTLENVTGKGADYAGELEEWISAQGRAVGVADDDLRPALDSLIRGTGDLQESTKLASLAMDISAGTGKDLTTVSDALSKAYNGQLGPLKKLDPALNDLIKSGASTDEVMQALSQTFEGQAAAAADTTAGKLQIAKLQFAEMQEEIGARVIPILANLATFLVEDVIPAIEATVAWVQEHWPQVQQVIDEVMQRVRAVIEEVLGAIEAFWRTWGGTITAYLQGLWEALRQIIEGAMNVIRGVINTVMGLIHGDFSQVWEGIRQIFSGIWEIINGLVDAAINGLKTIIEVNMRLIAGVFDAIWEEIKSTVSGAIESVKTTVTTKIDEMFNAIKELPGKISGLAGEFLNAGKEMASSLVDGIMDGVTSIGDYALDFANAFKDAVKSVINEQIIDRINDLLEFDVSIPTSPWSQQDFHVDPRDIPHLHTGGVVPGTRGSEVPAMLLAGEAVFTEDQQAALGRLIGRGSAGTGSQVHFHIGTLAATPKEALSFASTVSRISLGQKLTLAARSTR